jgi:dTDP-glucose 4,6-dehydratase
MIPLFVTNLMEGKQVPLYGDGMNIRDWLYVEDHCDAIWTVLNKGRFGEVYNIGGNNEITNRKITETILREMGKDWDTSVKYVKDRPGHDRRYAIDATKIQKELGWWPEAQVRGRDQDHHPVVQATTSSGGARSRAAST